MKYTKTKILLLGGNGFLGKQLQALLDPLSFEVLLVTRTLNNQSTFPQIQTTDSTWLDSIALFDPDITVNMLAAWGPKINDAELWVSNFSLAEQVSSAIGRNKVHHWIQCNSYFNYFFDISGEDKDQYSYLRRIFTEQLIANFQESWAISELRLPHLTGVGQSKTQLLPNLIEAIFLNQKMELSSGTQYLPTATARNISEDILKVISSPRFIGHKYWKIAPTEQLTIRQIVEIIEKVSARKANVVFGALEDRDKEFYSSIAFLGEEIDSNSNARIRINQVVEEYLDVNFSQKSSTTH